MTLRNKVETVAAAKGYNERVIKKIFETLDLIDKGYEPSGKEVSETFIYLKRILEEDISETEAIATQEVSNSKSTKEIYTLDKLKDCKYILSSLGYNNTYGKASNGGQKFERARTVVSNINTGAANNFSLVTDWYVPNGYGDGSMSQARHEVSFSGLAQTLLIKNILNGKGKEFIKKYIDFNDVLADNRDLPFYSNISNRIEILKKDHSLWIDFSWVNKAGYTVGGYEVGEEEDDYAEGNIFFEIEDGEIVIGDFDGLSCLPKEIGVLLEDLGIIVDPEIVCGYKG